MIASISVPSRHRGTMPTLDKLVAHWKQHWEETFPDLPAALPRLAELSDDAITALLGRHIDDLATERASR